MKKIFALLLVVLLALSSFAGCGGSKEKTVASIQKAGKLVIATSPDFPPFEELQSDGSVVGIEVDILNLVCAELGVTLEIQQMDFDSVLPGVQAGKYDVGMSGISVTEERQKNVLFTSPYCLAAQAIVVNAGRAIAGKTDLMGKKIAVQSGTTAETFCMGAGYDVSSFSANSDAETALVTGKVDAWVIDDLTAADMVKAYNADNGEQLVILGEAMTTEPYAFAFPFGSEDLVKGIDEILAKLVESGKIAEIFAAYEAPYTKP